MFDPNKLQMTISLQIYGAGNQNLRLEKQINLDQNLTLEQAEKVLTKFSELAEAVQKEQKTGE